MSAPNLPEELVDEVLSYVGDPWTLKVCSLVCHSWVPLSQSHLYRRIDMSVGTVDDFMSTYSLCQRFQLYPHLAQYVRHISFEIAGYQSMASTVQQESLVAAMLPHFSNLTAITLSRASSTDGSVESPALLNAICATISSPRIDRVSLSGNWHFANLAQFTSLIGATIHSLKSLTIQGINVSEIVPGHALLQKAGPPAVIQSLTIAASTQAADGGPGIIELLTEWFKLSARPVEVKELFLCVPREDVYLASFVDIFASSLDTLDLAGHGVFQLGTLRALTKLFLWCHPRLPMLLKTLPLDNTLELLEVKLTYDSEPHYASLARELDEYLSPERFPHLQAVRLLIFYGASVVESSSEPLKQLWPLLIGRRKLQVRQGEGDILMSDTLEGLDMGLVFTDPLS